MKYVINAKFLSQKITGSQQVGVGLSKYLKNQLEDSLFITTKHIIHTETAKTLDAISVGTKNNLLWDQLELPFFLKKKGSPLLIDFGNTAPVFYKNKICTILDISPVLHPEWFSYKSATYLKLIIHLYIKNSRKIIAISEYTKQSIVDRYKIDGSSIHVVYPACPEVFSIPYSSDSKDKNKYGDFILAVSSIDPRKNFLGLIKAFKLAKLKDLKLVIVGSESKVFADQNLKGEIGGNKSIIFTGYINDDQLKNLYQTALFFVYPSFFEGFGIPPLEAMKCGCPTIVSSTTSLPEVCGDASFYIDPYNIDSIVQSLRTLYESAGLRQKLAEKGFAQADLFSWQKSATKLIKVIKNTN